MTVTNYYLVNKETKKVHFLLKLDSNFLAKDGQAESWMAGNVYHSYPDCAMTLEELYSLDYSEDYRIPNLPCGDTIFEQYANVHYASYKGYRLFYAADALKQVYSDFGGNDLIEMNAFLATLFKQFIGPEEVAKWSDSDNKFDDDYGVNELVMRHFTIESDHHEGVHYHRSLSDDSVDWQGFPKHK
jgi:hypothetical protein